MQTFFKKYNFMKKLVTCLCSTLFCVFVLTAHSQDESKSKSESSVIVKGGVNFANVTVSDDGDVDDAKSLTSFQVGIIGDVYLAPVLYLQPGIIFTGKGTKTQSGTEGSANWYKATSNPYYIEIPVNLVFKTPGKTTKFFAGAGPYLGIGIAGKNKVRGALLGTQFSSESNIDFSNDDPTTLNQEEGAGFGIMKRFDYGLNGLAGIETGGVVIAANYGLGLAKLQSGSNSGDDNNNKHRVFSLSVGFKF
jgi:hypothetical protein